MKKLTKSKTDSMISGVCGGIAEYFGVDSTIVRVGYLIFTFLGVGSPILLYLLLSVIIPEDNNY